MRKYFLGALFMLMILKPAVGLALFSILAEGMQTAASAMAHGVPPIRVDASNTSFAPATTFVPLEQASQGSAMKAEDVFEERVMAIIEKKRLHEEEQVESQKKLAEADAMAKAEKAGIELFDEEFKKKFPKKD